MHGQKCCGAWLQEEMEGVEEKGGNRLTLESTPRLEPWRYLAGVRGQRMFERPLEVQMGGWVALQSAGLGSRFESCLWTCSEYLK